MNLLWIFECFGYFFLKIAESDKITVGVQRSMQIFDDGSVTARYIEL